MDKDELQRKKDIVQKLKRRRHERELQQAQYGSMADPSIKMDIEDLTEEIKKIEREIAQPVEPISKAEPDKVAQVTQPSRNQPVTVDTRELRRRMLQKFDDERLDLLCDDINALLKQAGETTIVSRAIVGGRGLEVIILNLIQYLERRGLLSFLVDALRDVQPDII